MKILKLSLIFLATLGIVVGALWLTMGGSSSTRQEEMSGLYRELSDSIVAQWQDMDPWSREAYDETRTDLAQKKDMDLLDSDEHDRLAEMLRNSAINRLYTLTVEEFAKPECRHDVVTAYDKEAQRFNREKADKERLQKLHSIYTLYANIRAFVGSSLIYTPRFDGNQWTSLNDLRDAAVRRATGYRNNALYTEFLSHINGFSSGLTETTVRNKVEKGRSRYYAALSEQIISYFDSKDPTTDAAVQLESIYTRFRNEHAQGSGPLYHFYLNFKKKRQ